MRENFVRIKQKDYVWVIHTSKSMGKHIIVRILIEQIIQDVQISDGQITRDTPIALNYNLNRHQFMSRSWVM